MSGDDIQKQDDTSQISEQTETETTRDFSQGHDDLALLALNLTDSQVDQTIFRFRQLHVLNSTIGLNEREYIEMSSIASNTDVISRVQKLIIEATINNGRITTDGSRA
ncbi:hypothetical protein V865_005661 [Kwoniella europaea PYCC6329]|uniref:Uncharacterized protein n=1 Tax=Kwoniella europaea PYCC6329 TaxID=1423913 RepID=A0AAX4KPN3_9TREE